MQKRNVLIFQTGGLGDFVLTWPFAVALGRIYPQSRIIYVTHRQKGDLARRVLRLEATDIEAGWHGLFADDGKLPPAAAGTLAAAHSVYSFLPTGDVWHQNVDRLSPGVRRIEIDCRVPADFPGHITEQMIAALKDHPPERSALEQLLRSIAERGIGYKPPGGTDVVIHPGSGGREKCWPLDRYVALADRFKTAGRTVRFITGEVEQERWSASDLAQIAGTARHRCCQTLLELLSEIETAGQFIGNDSGPAHLAGILGIPTLALFGPGNPVQFKPLGPRVGILKCDSFGQLSVDAVYQDCSTIPKSNDQG